MRKTTIQSKILIMIITKSIISLSFLILLTLTSCSNSGENKSKDLELKQKELELKEREISLLEQKIKNESKTPKQQEKLTAKNEKKRIKIPLLCKWWN